MTWQEKYICWILLIIGRMLAEDEGLQTELRYLSNSIKQASK